MEPNLSTTLRLIQCTLVIPANAGIQFLALVPSLEDPGCPPARACRPAVYRKTNDEQKPYSPEPLTVSSVIPANAGIQFL
jgi:hypothetical protein